MVAPAVVGLLGDMEAAGNRRHFSSFVEHPVGLVELADDVLGRRRRLTIVNILPSPSNLGTGSGHGWFDLRGSGHGVGRLDPCRHGKAARNRV